MTCEDFVFNKYGEPIHAKICADVWVCKDCYDEIIKIKTLIPWIKFSNTESTKMSTENLVPISISDNPVILTKNTILNIPTKKLNKVKQWIIFNKDSLLKVWNGDITPTQFVTKYMKKL